MRLDHGARALTLAVLVCDAASVAQTQSPADFYKGKTVDLMIGYFPPASIVVVRLI